MNPAEIYDALATLAAKPYDPVEFPVEFAAATDNNPGTIAKLRNGSFNKSDLPGGVLMNQKFHFAPALTGMAAVTLFDAPSARYLRDVSAEDWKGINPDIFGSMIQSVANAELRSELGMHYTSVPNIMKVLGPLFLDELDEQIDRAWDREKGLRQVLDRISKIRVFDPACGSGNFLVVAYRALREREIRILSRISELTGGAQTEMWSVVPIRNFYGIDLADFAVETAKLALFIAEYQANALFQQAFGRKPADLPLRDAANVVCGNALRLNWEAVCPVPEDGGEVFIAGNPPFLGDNSRSDEQNEDMDHVLAAHLPAHRRIDFVSCWVFKAANYIRGRNARSALVSTNSICQGQSVGALWPYVLTGGVEIGFAHTSFKWRNNASANAAVVCVVVGLRNASREPKRLFSGVLEAHVGNINAYLLDGPDMFVGQETRSIFGLPYMEYGNKPTDGGNLILSQEERDDLLEGSCPNAWCRSADPRRGSSLIRRPRRAA